MDDAAVVYEQALRWLAQRPYAERELARRLSRKGASEEHIEHTLSRCHEWGYLDDAAFADALIRSRMVNKGFGPLRVRAELRDRGVAEHLIADALARTKEAGTDPVRVAQRALDKRYGLQDRPLDLKEKKRRFDFLARRGFDRETIWRALESHEDG